MPALEDLAGSPGGAPDVAVSRHSLRHSPIGEDGRGLSPVVATGSPPALHGGGASSAAVATMQNDLRQFQREMRSEIGTLKEMMQQLLERQGGASASAPS